MDWDVVVILAAVTWLDGVRRVPAGALVLRRMLGDRWSAADAPGTGGRQLVAWWSPFTLALVVPPGGIATDGRLRNAAGHGVEDRVARLRRTAPALRALGAAVLAGIVIGIPAAVARAGGWGFVAAVSGVLFLSLTTAVVATYAVRRLGCSWRQAARVTAPLLSPFTAPRAAELALEHAVAGAPPIVVARGLLDATSFAAWIRPRAYDALSAGGGAGDDAAELLAVVERSRLAAIMQTPPSHCEPGDCWCLRCGRAYRPGTPVCADCEGVPLAPTAAGLPLQIQV